MTNETLNRAKELQSKIKFYENRIETLNANKEFTIVFDKTTKIGDVRQFPDPAISIHSVCSPDGKNTAELYNLVFDYYVNKLEKLRAEFETL